MAEVTRVRHDVTGAEFEAPSEALEAWRGLGWQPVTGESRTRDDADLERIVAEEAAAAHAGEVAALVDDPNRATVPVVLAEVGDDPVAARAALDAELAHDDPRTTLVRGLEHVIARSETAGDPGATKES